MHSVLLGGGSLAERVKALLITLVQLSYSFKAQTRLSHTELNFFMNIDLTSNVKLSLLVLLPALCEGV